MQFQEKEQNLRPYTKPMVEGLELLQGLSLLATASLQSEETVSIDLIEDEGEL